MTNEPQRTSAGRLVPYMFSSVFSSYNSRLKENFHKWEFITIIVIIIIIIFIIIIIS